MAGKATPKTLQQRQDERLAELDWEQQMNAYHAALRAEKQKEQDDFMAAVQARRDRVDSYIKHSFAQRANTSMTEPQLAALRAEIEAEAYVQVRATIPTIGEIYTAKHAQEVAAQEQAEQARIAALSPRDVWLSTLTWQERQRIAKWEQINKGQQWPYAPAESGVTA